jgi:hypothetical protein
MAAQRPVVGGSRMPSSAGCAAGERADRVRRPAEETPSVLGDETT